MGAKYYESELAYLREMGREFAKVHPSTAGLLGERGSDPDVERLLQGFAFLSARIRERVDDAVPAIVDGLMQLLLPHYLRTVPACSIIEFTPALTSIRGVHQIERGTRVAARAMGGTSCEFRTTMPVELLPLQLTEVELGRQHVARPSLTLSLQTTETGRHLLAGRALRFMLFGDASLTSTLYLWLMRHTRRVSLVVGGAPVVELGGEAVSGAGFDPASAMLPWPPLAHEGYRILQEYFTLPERLMFVDVAAFPDGFVPSEQFGIRFEFEGPPAVEQRLAVENFRLFCTPVINLFDASAEPVKLEPGVYEHLLRPTGLPPAHAEVYEVRSVVGIRQGEARRRAYDPFVGFAHAADSADGRYYTLRPTASPVDDGLDTYLSVGGGPSEDEVLSLELVCTNRSLATELQLGEIGGTPRGVSSPAPFRNIVPISPPVRPKMGSEMHWRLLSHLAIGRKSLTDPEILRAVLALYNFQRDANVNIGRTNDRRIESIRAIASIPVTRMLGGAPVRGIQTTIELEHASVGSVGEAFVFGCVLDELLGAHVPLNAFNELVVSLHPNNVQLRWPARGGTQAIL